MPTDRPTKVDVRKTYKLFIGGAFPRSESGRSYVVSSAGGDFLGKAGAQCSAEEIARQDPEVIIAAWCGAGDRVPLAKIVAERGWADTTAVRNSQVYCISDELLNTPAPTLVSGLRALAGAIQPAVFGSQPGLRSITQASRPQLPATMNRSGLV